MAQSFEVDDGHATIFEPQQTFFLQPLQALVGILPGDTGERSDFFLRDLQMSREVGIENRIEQGCDGARQPRGRVQRAAIFEQRDELAQTFVELPDQEAVEAYACLRPQLSLYCTAALRRAALAPRHRNPAARRRNEIC
jgi:hypothetical protein